MKNFGGQQTSTDPPGVSVARVGVGIYDVTFRANTGTGRFLKVDSVDDLAIVANGQKNTQTSAGLDPQPALEPIISIARNRSSANENEVKLRVIVEDGRSGTKTDAADFSVFFYARTVN